MNIVCATDDNFVQHCCIMLTSVLLNNSNVSVFVLSEGLSSLNQNILQEEVEFRGGVYNYYEVDNTIIKQFPMPDLEELRHISSATYCRLLIDKLLPVDIEKVIYLDCDVIIRKSLKELWDIDMNNFSIAAVSQIPSENDCIRLKYDPRYAYFNAGILVINLEYWRMNNVADHLISCLINNYNTIIYHDQDALNIVLHESRLVLSPRWNMLYPFFITGKRFFNELKQTMLENKFAKFRTEIKKEKKDPIVIHYSSKPKPWEEYCYHPWKNEYFKYAASSKHFHTITKPDILNSFYASLKQNFRYFLSNVKWTFLK